VSIDGPAQEAPAVEPESAPDSAHDREIETVKKRIEVMRWGVEIWVEKGRRDLAEQLELAIVPRRMAVEGRRDAEAAAARERAPGPGQLAELLGGAGRAYAEKGWETRAAACDELAEVFREQWRRKEQREGAGRRELEERLHRFMVRTEELEERVQRFMERTEELEVRMKRFVERTEALEVRVRELTERLEQAESRAR